MSDYEERHIGYLQALEEVREILDKYKDTRAYEEAYDEIEYLCDCERV